MKFAAAALLSAMAIAGDNQMPAPFDFQVMYSKKKNQDVLVMQFTMPNDSTMGINLGEKMTGADSIICSVHETGVVGCFDMTVPKVKDVKQNLITFNAPETEEGITKITLTRALDTKDEADFVVPLDTDFSFGWSINDECSHIADAPTHVGSGLKLNIPSTGE